MKGFKNFFRLGLAHRFSKGFNRSFFDPFHRFETFQELLRCFFAHALNALQFRIDGPLAPFVPVMRNAEPVGLVPELLDDLQGLRAFVQVQWYGIPWKIYFFQTLGNADDGDLAP